MGDELSDVMNLGLNQDPLSGSMPSETVDLAEFMEEPARRTRGAVRIRTRQQRLRRRRLHIAPENRNISMESNRLMGNEGGSVSKTCENNNGLSKEDDSPKVDAEKGCGDDRSFYDCNICLNVARDTVVTPCGHLFCWPCLYRWLCVFSGGNQCPVCKGEATIKTLTPIYGCGSSAHEAEGGPGLNIPVRPRVELVSWAQLIQRQLSLEERLDYQDHRHELLEEKCDDMYRKVEERDEAWRITREKQLQWNENAALERDQILARLKEGGQSISPAAVEAMLQAFFAPIPVLAHLPPLTAIAPLPPLTTRAPLPPVPVLAPPFSNDASNSGGSLDEGNEDISEAGGLEDGDDENDEGEQDGDGDGL